MKLLNTTHKRKSAIITSILMLLLILLIFVIGLDYKDPPDEYGVEINFGYTDAGSGDNTTSTEEVKTEPNQQQEEKQQEQQPETPVKKVEPQETKTQEDVITQETEDAPVVTKKKKTKPVVKTTPKKTVEPVKKVTPAPPKPDKSTTDALNSILNGPSKNGTSNKGDGDTNKQGNQGKIDGNPYASSYYGSGSGNGSGYGLNGRNKLGYKKTLQDCNEEGKVVVKIYVNRSGRVTKTIIQQSDDPCLNAAAKKTALSYKFNADSKAPATQTGFVVVNFSLGK